MPNPNGYDDAAWPGGEWAEVKNTGAVAVSVLNWQLQNSNGKTLDFDANSIVGYNSSNSSTWTIQPGSWMVIARNADTNFWMTNTPGDTLSLYDANSTKVDEATWNGGSSGVGSGIAFIEDPADAYADWIAANNSTPGSANGGSAPPPTYSQSDLMLSEVFPNPVFTPDNASWPGGEWFEVYNNGSTTMNLSGWSAYDAAGNVIPFDQSHLVGYDPADSNSWMIAPGEYRIVAVNSSSGYGVLNNNQETLTLQMPNGSLVETISWGTVLSGTSKVASASGVWITTLFPTPFSLNVGWLPDAINGTSDIVLNEVLANSSTTSSSFPDGDWFELYNNGSSTIDLAGWEYVNSVGIWVDIDANTLLANTSQSGTYILPGEYRIVQGEILGNPQYLHHSYDSISLHNNNGELVDALHWTNNFGLNISLVGGDYVADAWTPSAYPTPGQVNPGAVTAVDAEIFISEIMPDDVGNDTRNWPDGEWIELVNIGNDTIDLAGWSLIAGGNKQLTITAERIIGQNDTFIEAGEYIIIPRNGSSGFYLRNSNGDSLALQDNTSSVVHSVVWTLETDEGESLVVPPGDAQGNWIQAIWPTPGEPNPFFGPYTGADSVEITEVLPHCYDDAQTPPDDWIELHNTGTQQVNLSRWSLAAGEGEDVLIRHDNIWNRSATSPTVTLLEADEYMVILAPNYFIKGYGDSLSLSNPDGNTTHSITWTITTDCDSLGRADDSAQDWVETMWPTPGEENPDPADYNFDADIQFTRLMPYQTDYNERNNEFFELTNFGATHADLSGWVINKISSGGAAYNASFTNLILTPGEVIAITPDAGHLGLDGGFTATSALDVMTSALYLTDNGGTLQLYNPQGTLVDAVAWKDAALPIEGWNGPAITNPNVSTTGLIYLRGDGCGNSADTNSSADWQVKWSRLGASHLCLETTFATTGTLTATIGPNGALGELLQFIDSAESSIHVHVYQMYSAELVHALKSAAGRGVAVTVVLNEPEYAYWSSYDTDRQYGMASELSDAGATVLFIGEPLDDDAPSSPYPYMHSKVAVKDDESVWIGSGNWKSSSHPTADYGGNREWGVIIDSSDVATMVLQRMAWDENPAHNHVLNYQSSMKPSGWATPVADTDPQPYGQYSPISGSFSGRILTCPDDCMEGLVATILSADESILLSLASFDLDWYWGWGENPVLEALEQKAGEGVKIHMIIDDSYSNDETREAVDLFNNEWNRSNGWDTAAVIISTSDEIYSLHNKGMIVDGDSVLISSINWNANSILRNREMGIVIDNTALSAIYAASWQEDWDRLDMTTDTDSDTLPDYWEVAYGLNRTNAFITDLTIGEEGIDSDNDGLINSLEFAYGGDPFLADTDGDCIPDGKEAAWAMSLDGLSNEAKIQFAIHAMNSEDADDNGENDGVQFDCGVDFVGSTTVISDSDGDGVADADDRCPLTPTGTTVDIEGCPVSQNTDQDGDGIPDAVDECPDTPPSTAVSVHGCSDQQSRDRVGSGTGEDEEDNKSKFFFYAGAVALVLLLGSMVGVVNSYRARNRNYAEDEDDKELTDIQGEWSTAALDFGAMPVLDGSTDSTPATSAEATSHEDGTKGDELVPTAQQGTEVAVGAPIAAPAPTFDAGLFPGWTPEVIQTYLDQGWTLEQLKNWYDQHS